MAEANNIIKDFRAPPTLGKDYLYVNQKKENLGDIYVCPRRKTCPAIFMTLTEEAREAILNMDIERLLEKIGVNNLMAELY